MSSRQRPSAEERQAMRERQRDDAIHQNQLGFDEQDSPNSEYLREIARSELQPATIRYIDNLLSNDFIHAKINEAEKNEMRWLLRVLKKKVIASHPPHESVLQGEYRAFVFDDPDETFESLTRRERMEIETYLWGVMKRISRSEHGWQQDKYSETIKRSEVVNNKEQSESFIQRLLS